MILVARRKYKIDTGSDRNLMPLNIIKILFLKATMEQPARHKDKKDILQTFFVVPSGH